MKWATRSKIKVGRAATAWLIKRFVDQSAIFVFCPDDDEIRRLESLGEAVGFQVPGAKYPHIDALGRTPFEAIAAEYCPTDSALQRMGRMVRDADIKTDDPVPEAAGIRLISKHFHLVSPNDNDIVERSSFMYDALYAGIAATERRR